MSMLTRKENISIVFGKKKLLNGSHIIAHISYITFKLHISVLNVKRNMILFESTFLLYSFLSKVRSTSTINSQI